MYLIVECMQKAMPHSDLDLHALYIEILAYCLQIWVTDYRAPKVPLGVANINILRYFRELHHCRGKIATTQTRNGSLWELRT